MFYIAWTGGHPGIAKKLLDHGAELTQNIFFAAIGHFQRHGDGNYEVAEVLLEHGFDINWRYPNLYTRLSKRIWVCAAGLLE